MNLKNRRKFILIFAGIAMLTLSLLLAALTAGACISESRRAGTGSAAVYDHEADEKNTEEAGVNDGLPDALPDSAFFADTEHDQGSFWNYIEHTKRSYQMKQIHFIPLILLLSWIPILVASAVSIFLFCREDTVVKSYAGGVSGEISEVFDPADAKDLLPRDSFRKEVSLCSTSDIDTRAYIRVEIPVIPEKEPSGESRLTDALSPEINSDSFQLVSSLKGQRNGDFSVYLYRYRKPLLPGAKTPPLFESMQVPDFEGIDSLENEVRVSGYLIQWENFTAKQADKLARAWSRQGRHEDGSVTLEGSR